MPEFFSFTQGAETNPRNRAAIETSPLLVGRFRALPASLLSSGGLGRHSRVLPPPARSSRPSRPTVSTDTAPGPPSLSPSRSPSPFSAAVGATSRGGYGVYNNSSHSGYNTGYGSIHVTTTGGGGRVVATYPGYYYDSIGDDDDEDDEEEDDDDDSNNDDGYEEDEEDDDEDDDDDDDDDDRYGGEEDDLLRGHQRSPVRDDSGHGADAAADDSSGSANGIAAANGKTRPDSSGNAKARNQVAVDARGGPRAAAIAAWPTYWGPAAWLLRWARRQQRRLGLRSKKRARRALRSGGPAGGAQAPLRRDSQDFLRQRIQQRRHPHRRHCGRRCARWCRLAAKRTLRHLRNLWLTPKHAAVRRVVDRWWMRWTLLVILPAVLAIAWSALPFPQYPLEHQGWAAGAGSVDAALADRADGHRPKGHGEARVRINFWFFLFVYYGAYNVTALIWITKVFNLYSLNWWPSSVGFPLSVSSLTAVSLAVPAVGFATLPAGIFDFLATHNTAWVTWTFMVMAMPVTAALLLLVLHERHLGLRHSLSDTQRIFTSARWAGEPDTLPRRRREQQRLRRVLPPLRKPARFRFGATFSAADPEAQAAAAVVPPPTVVSSSAAAQDAFALSYEQQQQQQQALSRNRTPSPTASGAASPSAKTGGGGAPLMTVQSASSVLYRQQPPPPPSSSDGPPPATPRPNHLQHSATAPLLIPATFSPVLLPQTPDRRAGAAGAADVVSMRRSWLPASFVRFLWLMSALFTSLMVFELGEASASLFLAALPQMHHETIYAVVYIWAWTVAVFLLDALTGWILGGNQGERVGSYPLGWVFKLYFMLTYQTYVRALYVRLRKPSQFVFLQVLSSTTLILITPILMSPYTHRFLAALGLNGQSYGAFQKVCVRNVFIRFIAENASMLAFLGSLMVLHFGPNRDVYPYFAFDDADDGYTYSFTLYASSITWGCELVAAVLVTGLIRYFYGVAVIAEGKMDLAVWPELLPTSVAVSVHVLQNMLFSIIRLKF